MVTVRVCDWRLRAGGRALYQAARCDSEPPVVTPTDDAADDAPTTIKFIVGSRESNKCSYAWRLWAHGTSFYVASMSPGMQGLTISLHGPDPRPGLTPRYHVTLHERAAASARQVGTLMKRIDWPDRHVFSGHQVYPDVDLVMRLRFDHDLFDVAAVSAPIPKAPRRGEVGLLIPTPTPGHAVDVDLHVCHRQPRWPDEEQARRDNALIGPLRNTAGQYLTGQSIHRRVATNPSPVQAKAPAPRNGIPPALDRVRGNGAAFDEEDVLWVHEMWLSQSGLHPSFSMFHAPAD